MILSIMINTQSHFRLETNQEISFLKIHKSSKHNYHVITILTISCCLLAV